MARPDGEVREVRLMSACAFRLSFASSSLRWLVVASPFVTSPPPCVARRAAISHSLDAWIHRRCPFCIAVAPSIAVAVALPSCRPSPPSLVDCCRFHRHPRVNVHPPLLPLLIFGTSMYVKYSRVPSQLTCCAPRSTSRKTLDWGGKGGAMRAHQKWFWHDSIFSCDRR